MNQLITLVFSVLLLIGLVPPVNAEELLWTERAGQMVCKQLSEGLKLISDTELLSIPGRDNFTRQIKANENPELLVFGQMLRTCPILTIAALSEPTETKEVIE